MKEQIKNSKVHLDKEKKLQERETRDKGRETKRGKQKKTGLDQNYW